MSELVEEPRHYHQTCHHRTYYLTCEEYDLLWRFADGRCQICGVEPHQTSRGVLSIDHLGDYGYMSVRGLLCDKCNALMRRVDSREKRPTPEVHDYMANAWFKISLMHARGFSVNTVRQRWEWPRRVG